MEHPSADLMMRWRDGDERAAREIFGRYAERLLALARSRISMRLARHVDPEDLVQSAYRSFFLGARDGKYVLHKSGDLWRLLVGITVHKLQHQVERRAAQKRAATREVEADGQGLAWQAEALAREPTPADAAALADMVEHLLAPLDPLQRRMVALRLDGHSLEEIAQEVSRSERTVRRVLEEFKVGLVQATNDPV